MARDRKETEGLSALGSASQFGRDQCVSEFREEGGRGNRGHQGRWQGGRAERRWTQRNLQR